MGNGAALAGNVALTGTGDVQYNGTTTVATISGNLDLGGNLHTFNINNGAAAIDMDISGVISNGSATKSTGTGVLQFSGASANTYIGITTINAGELVR